MTDTPHSSVKAFIQWCRKNANFVLVIGAITGLLLVSLIEPTLNIPPEKKEKQPDFSFENITLSEMENEKTNWELNAEEAKIYKDENQTQLARVTGQFFEGGRSMLDFASPEGYIDTQTSDMVFTEATATINFQNTPIIVEAERLSYSAATAVFYGKGNTSVKTDGITLTGKEFEIIVEEKKFRIKDSSEANITL